VGVGRTGRWSAERPLFAGASPRERFGGGHAAQCEGVSVRDDRAGSVWMTAMCGGVTEERRDSRCASSR
jgi:hypothetical protein